MQIYEKTSIFAAEIPITTEGIVFDSEGNLWMVTHDKAAVSGTRYCTLGWTIKRYNSGIPGNQSVRVKLETYCPDKVDPANPEYLYGYFMIHKDVIFQRISSAYPEWANELYSNGGMVYLDGIMTVTENGVKQGFMSESGALSGEAYTTYEGIAGARGWRDKEGLKSHFNKQVYFPANPSMLGPGAGPAEEGMEVVNVVSGINEGNLSSVNQLRIYSDVYQVERAIPSNEPLAISGSLQKYYYHATYEHYSGTKEIPVTANVTYTLTWNDGKPRSEQVTVPQTVSVNRPFSYWKIRDIQLSYLKNVSVSNGALPGGATRIENCYYPQVSIQKYGDNLTLPQTTVEIDGGTIAGGKTKPSIVEKDIFPLVDSVIGKIMVKNDYFSVDGEVWMNSILTEERTGDPVTLSGERKQSVGKSNLTIPAVIANQTWYSSAVAEYASYSSGGIVNSSTIPGVNSVLVHTPVFCEGKITDEKAFNQQIIPTPNKSLILGRSFTVSVGTAGQHVSEKGYGNREYGKYVKARQVCFPFEVSFDGAIIPKDTWITIINEKAEFLLPVAVEEGNYDIKYRSISINAEKNTTEESHANLNKSNYIAYDIVPVTVVGRLYDFQITNVIDYPRWEAVFWNDTKTEPTGRVYYSGTNDLNGIEKREITDLFLIPLLTGSHPYDSSVHAPGLGYRINFSLKTIGSMWHAEDKIHLTPTYYYMDQNGKNIQKVHLYEKEGLRKFYLPVQLAQNQRTIMEPGMQTWSGSYQIPPDVYIINANTDLEEYLHSRNNRITLKDPVFLKDGYLIVYFMIQTEKEGMLHLDYENVKNAAAGYCDMWKIEGFQTRRRDANGMVFTFGEGDVFVFAQKRNMLTDYLSIGTH